MPGRHQRPLPAACPAQSPCLPRFPRRTCWPVRVPVREEPSVPVPAIPFSFPAGCGRRGRPGASGSGVGQHPGCTWPLCSEVSWLSPSTRVGPPPGPTSDAVVSPPPGWAAAGSGPIAGAPVLESAELCLLGRDRALSHVSGAQTTERQPRPHGWAVQKSQVLFQVLCLAVPPPPHRAPLPGCESNQRGQLSWGI